ncbi:MAG: M48 family metallopeptidase [Candidatus Kerfeldbacteria bacterium]|nr:M48 family metallopeptidase [Candidatus Kerfeldbacteria bacterium]
MTRNIQLQNTHIEYTLKTSRRAKRMRLNVYCDGSFVVTRPNGCSELIVEQFIARKADWVLTKLQAFKHFGAHEWQGDRVRFADYKHCAQHFVTERINHWNRFYNVRFNGVRVRNQKTRWGSCSSKRTLSFNYKILFLPPHAADYIIVHELCHLRELNHGPAFWRLVEQTVPNHKEVRNAYFLG